MRGSRAWLLAWVPVGVGLVRARRRLGLPRPLSALLAPTVPLALAAAVPRSRGRHAAVWAAHMWAYKASFEIPYDDPEKLRRRLRVLYPLRIDRALGAGVAPGERLQRRLRRPLEVTRLDRALAALYVAWDAEPHAVLAWILVRRPERFAHAAVRLALTFDLSLVGYWLVPTAPPWWASERHGLMGGRVARGILRVRRDLHGDPLEQGDVRDANPWASMPSDHFAVATATAMLLAELNPVAGAAGWAYALALGFALVHHGEHYVVDLLAGLALAEAVRRTVR
ncbi:MAG TPA: phosphatase PAP2 family protein [Solirubrobacteraceae bacterium]|jgi:membrane-associated phospholipid phosphatase